MKELIEKIKKEIKKEIESYMDLQCDFEDHEMSYQEEILDNHYEGCKSGLETAIDIINKEAKSYNNGWIPCSLDLPKIPNSYLVTKMCENDGNPIYETAHEIFWTSDKKWDCERDEDCEWKVIAWQNKIAPYQPKGE